MCTYMCVFHSRSVYASTRWRETRGCYLKTHHMNYHRRERSGVCMSVCRCSEPQMFCKRTRKRWGGEIEAVFSVWEAGVTWMNMRLSQRDLIIKTHEDPLRLSYLPPLTFFFSSFISIALSLKLTFYLIFCPRLITHPSLSLWQTISLSCQLPFHLLTSLHQSVVALFFLSTHSLPEEPWSTKPPVFQSFYSPPPSVPTAPISLSHLQSLSPRKCCRANSLGDSARGPSARHSDPLLS